MEAKAKTELPIKSRGFPNVEPDNFRRQQWEIDDEALHAQATTVNTSVMSVEAEPKEERAKLVDILHWHIEEMDFAGETKKREYFEDNEELHERIHALKAACDTLGMKLVFEHARYRLDPNPVVVGKSH